MACYERGRAFLSGIRVAWLEIPERKPNPIFNRPCAVSFFYNTCGQVSECFSVLCFDFDVGDGWFRRSELTPALADPPGQLLKRLQMTHGGAFGLK